MGKDNPQTHLIRLPEVSIEQLANQIPPGLPNFGPC